MLHSPSHSAAGRLLILQVLSVCSQGGLRRIVTHAVWAGLSERAELGLTGWILQDHIPQRRSEAALLRLGLVGMSQHSSRFSGSLGHALTAMSVSAEICAEPPTVAQAGKPRDVAGVPLPVVTPALGSRPLRLWAGHVGCWSRAPAQSPTERAGDPCDAVCFLFRSSDRAQDGRRVKKAGGRGEGH